MSKEKVVFFVLGKKGYEAIRGFINAFSADAIMYVVIAKDKGVEDDFYQQTRSLCTTFGIVFYERLDPAIDKVHRAYSFSIGWRWMIKETSRLIVFHDSLLPKYRGFAPLVNMLINGEERLGVTALFASDDYDRGEILEARSIAITYPIKIACAIELILPLYQELVISCYRKLISGEFKATEQIEAEASYSLWRNEDDYIIDWSWDASYISRFCDSVGPPYRGGKTFAHGNVVRIHDAVAVADVNVENRKANVGKIIFMRHGNYVVVCGSGLLEIKSLTIEGAETADLPFRTRFYQ